MELATRRRRWWCSLRRQREECPSIFHVPHSEHKTHTHSSHGSLAVDSAARQLSLNGTLHDIVCSVVPCSIMRVTALRPPKPWAQLPSLQPSPRLSGGGGTTTSAAPPAVRPAARSAGKAKRCGRAFLSKQGHCSASCCVSESRPHTSACAATGCAARAVCVRRWLLRRELCAATGL